MRRSSKLREGLGGSLYWIGVATTLGIPPDSISLSPLSLTREREIRVVDLDSAGIRQVSAPCMSFVALSDS